MTGIATTQSLYASVAVNAISDHIAIDNISGYIVV
jgi:hypothetical protein